LKAYQERAKKDLLVHPLLVQFQACDSPVNILTMLHDQVLEPKKSQRGDARLTMWLNPAVTVLLAFSRALVGPVSIRT
jgi:hypothetical protein